MQLRISQSFPPHTYLHNRSKIESWSSCEMLGLSPQSAKPSRGAGVFEAAHHSTLENGVSSWYTAFVFSILGLPRYKYAGSSEKK